MATTNKRIYQPQALTINAIAAGGLVQHRIQAGYDDILQNPVDGQQLAMADFLTEFVRGSFTTQDWVHIIELLTGTVGTSVFYQRKSGVADATGYIKHSLLNPIIHKMSLNITHRKYSTAEGSYECKAADETDGIADLWTMTDTVAAPTFISSDRGCEITACTFGGTPAAIYHVTSLRLDIELPLLKASHDGDKGYTTVETLLNGIRVSGELRMQHAEITTTQIKASALVQAAAGPLVLTVKQSQGAAAKTLTINGVKFTSAGHDTSADSNDPDEFSLPFMIVNNLALPLTLAGTTKIVTVA